MSAGLKFSYACLLLAIVFTVVAIATMVVESFVESSSMRVSGVLIILALMSFVVAVAEGGIYWLVTL